MQERAEDYYGNIVRIISHNIGFDVSRDFSN